MNASNFTLACCPRCSSRINLVRPEWNHARRTSTLRNAPHFIWAASCSHSVEFARTVPVCDAVGVETHTKRWDEECERMFRDLTKNWTNAQRALHARTLGNHFHASTEAQEQQPTKEK